MTLIKLNSLPNRIEFLLQKLKTLKQKTVYIQIDNTPDFNFADSISSEGDYYFRNSFRFDNYFTWVTKVDFEKIKIYHYDDFLRLSDEHSLQYHSSNEIDFLYRLDKIDKNIFYDNGFDAEFDLDEFKMEKIYLHHIDNIESKIFYEGKFFGDSYYIDPIDFGYFTRATIVGFKSSPENFYKEIIAESYLLKLEKKYKLSYFLVFTAFENFINSVLDSHRDKKELKDKVSLAFSLKFQNLSKHEIYSSIIEKFDDFNEVRNKIAHGDNSISINKNDVDNLFTFILTLILTHTNSLNHFSEIIE